MNISKKFLKIVKTFNHALRLDKPQTIELIEAQIKVTSEATISRFSLAQTEPLPIPTHTSS